MRRIMAILGVMLLTVMVVRADDATSQPTSQPTVLDGTDTAAVTAAEGKDVVIEGKIVQARWSKSGKVMTASFAKGRDSAALVIFSAKKDDMDKAFGGDVAATLKGATVRVTGTVKVYRNLPEIAVDSPDQITIVTPAATEPATQE